MDLAGLNHSRLPLMGRRDVLAVSVEYASMKNQWWHCQACSAYFRSETWERECPRCQGYPPDPPTRNEVIAGVALAGLIMFIMFWVMGCDIRHAPLPAHQRVSVEDGLTLMIAQKKKIAPLMQKLCPEVFADSFKGDFMDQIIACDKMLLVAREARR